MSDDKYLEELRKDIDATRSTITEIHREDYIKHSIDVIMKYFESLTPIDIAFAIKELFFIGSLDPSVLEGHPTFSIEGPARTLYVLEDYDDQFHAVIDELKILVPNEIDNILLELEDYTEGIFDGFGI